MSHHSSWFLYKTTVLSFAFLLFLATTALAAQREIIVMEMDVPAYASLEEAQKGKTDATLEAFPLMMAGEQYAYIVLENFLGGAGADVCQHLQGCYPLCSVCVGSRSRTSVFNCA